MTPNHRMPNTKCLTTDRFLPFIICCFLPYLVFVILRRWFHLFTCHNLYIITSKCSTITYITSYSILLSGSSSLSCHFEEIRELLYISVVSFYVMKMDDVLSLSKYYQNIHNMMALCTKSFHFAPSILVFC